MHTRVLFAIRGLTRTFRPSRDSPILRSRRRQSAHFFRTEDSADYRRRLLEQEIHGLRANGRGRYWSSPTKTSLIEPLAVTCTTCSTVRSLCLWIATGLALARLRGRAIRRWVLLFARRPRWRPTWRLPLGPACPWTPSQPGHGNRSFGAGWAGYFVH